MIYKVTRQTNLSLSKEINYETKHYIFEAKNMSLDLSIML